MLGLKRWLSSGEYFRFCRGPGFGSQNSHGSSQRPVTPVSGDPMDFCTHMVNIYSYGQIHIYIKNKNKQKNWRHLLPEVMEARENLRMLVRVMMRGGQAWKGD